MNQDQIEAVRAELVEYDREVFGMMAAKALRVIDHLTKTNEELRAEVELAKQEGVTETLQQIDCLTGGDGEYRLSTEADRNCPDEDAMRAKIVERFDDLRATIDRLTKERDEALAEADPELLTIAWLDGSHRSAKAARDEIKRLTTRISAMQEAIDEAVRRADRANAEVMPCTIEDVAAVLRPFAAKPEPEVDPLVWEVTVSILNKGESVVSLPELARLINGGARITALAARGGRVVFDGREG